MASRLLIEPYWNVNFGSGNHHWIEHNLLIEPYWNVNYSTHRLYCETSIILLIEPYWNVNYAITVMGTFLVWTFNRTILECKLFLCRLLCSLLEPGLLIEPYWNVNTEIERLVMDERLFDLLIEPYWNVNAPTTFVLIVLIAPFNRTILECKLVNKSVADNSRELLIEPYWNVNNKYLSLHFVSIYLLIEPYWNVNVQYRRMESGVYRLLIEPYWCHKR